MLEGAGEPTSAALPPPPAGVVVPATDAPDGVPPGALRGRVVDPEGLGVAGVSLSVSVLCGGTHHPTIYTSTEDDGRFSVGMEDLTGCIASIRILGAGHHAAPRPLRVPCTNEEVVIRLKPGGSITGTVVPGARGMPGRMALTAHWTRGRSWVSQQVRMRKDGTFEIRGIPVGTSVDVVGVPAHERKRPEFRTESGNRIPLPNMPPSWVPEPAEATTARATVPAAGVELRLGTPPVIEITASADGKPLANQRFSLQPMKETGLRRVLARSDAQGRLVVRGLPHGRYRVHPVSGTYRGYVVEVPGEPLRRDFSLSTTTDLHGRIVGGDVGGFRITTRAGGTASSHTAVADAEGRFRIRFVDSRVSLHVGRFGDERWGRAADVDPHGGEVEVHLQRGASIEGRVYDVDGKPYQGEGWVRAVGPDFESRVAMPAGGHFTLHGLPPGRYTLHAGGVRLDEAVIHDVAAGSRDVRIDIPTGR